MFSHSSSSHFFSTSQSALGPSSEPSGISNSFLSICYLSFSFCLSCCLLLFPLTILLIVFPTPSVAPSPLVGVVVFCLFPGSFLPLFGFSSFHPSFCPYFCFLPSLWKEVKVFLVTWTHFLQSSVFGGRFVQLSGRGDLVNSSFHVTRSGERRVNEVHCHSSQCTDAHRIPVF